MKSIFDLFDVRRRELPRLLPVISAYGLVMASLYVLKPARNALFLDRLGVAQLPYVLLLVAFVGGAAALVFTRFSRRVQLDRLVFFTFLVLGACLLGFRALLPTGWWWTYYLFYVWVNLYGLMATSLLWLLANALFNAREGRRLFGLIGTSGIVGAILGGGLTSWVVVRVGTENLLFVCAAMLGVCLLLLYPVRVRETRSAGATEVEGQSPLATVRASQLLSLLAGMAGLAAAVAAIIDVQFNYIVDQAFADRDAKTAFFGQFFAGLSAFAFLFQIAVTPRVLRSVGVIPALLFLPLSMAMGSVAVLLVPGLAAAVLLKVGDGGFRHSIHKSATEILYLPVPVEAKKRTKVLLDTTVDNLATGLGALAVMAALAGGLAYRHLSFVSLALAGDGGAQPQGLRRDLPPGPRTARDRPGGVHRRHPRGGDPRQPGVTAAGHARRATPALRPRHAGPGARRAPRRAVDGAAAPWVDGGARAYPAHAAPAERSHAAGAFRGAARRRAPRDPRRSPLCAVCARRR